MRATTSKVVAQLSVAAERTRGLNTDLDHLLGRTIVSDVSNLPIANRVTE